MRLDLPVEWFCHFRIEQWQHLWLHLDQRDLHATPGKLLGNLEADKTTTDHDRTLCLGHGRGDPVRILQVTQRKHPACMQTPHGRRNGAGSRRQDQLVVVLRIDCAGGVILYGHRLGHAVNGRHFLPRTHVNTESPFKQLLRRHQQFGAVLNFAAQVIWQAAVGEGNIGVLLKHHDARLLVHAAGASRRGSAAGDAPHDQDRRGRGGKVGIGQWCGHYFFSPIGPCKRKGQEKSDAVQARGFALTNPSPCAASQIQINKHKRLRSLPLQA